MKELITIDKEFKIIPQDISGATKCIVKNTVENEFEVELNSDEKYIEGEPVELFSITPQGVLYFTTDIKAVNGTNIRMTYPNDYKLLQRREYTRIGLSKNVFLLTKEAKKIQSTIMDLSAGGMKLTAVSQLELSESYSVELDLDKNTIIKVNFQPIRVETDNLLGYTVSGRFKNLKNIDRISLVQFCFKKQMEEQNK